MNSYLQILRIKHVFALILAVLVATSFINLVQYRIIPIWVLHEPTSQDVVFNATHFSAPSPASLHFSYSYTSTCSIPHFIVSFANSIERGSLLILYRLPSYSDLTNIIRAVQSGEKSLIHRITLVRHLPLSDSHILATKVECIRGDLILAVLSSVESANYTNYVVSVYNHHFRLSWERIISPIPENAVSRASLVIYPSDDLSHSELGNYLYLTLSHQTNDIVSIWTLSLKDGRVLWKYLTVNLIEKSELIHVNFSGKFWKAALLDYYDTHAHVDESPWNSYGADFEQLPPMRRYDKGNIQLIPVKITQDNSNMRKSTHLNNNALVCVHTNGMILLDLTSGKPIARLEREFESGSTYAYLPSVKQVGYFAHTLGPVQLHQLRLTSVPIRSTQQSFQSHLDESMGDSNDVEGDLQDDHHMSATIDCRGVAQPVQLSIPRPSIVYRGLCRPHSWFEFSRFGSSEWMEDHLKSVPPLVIPSSYPMNDLLHFWNHLFPSLAVTSHDYNPLHIPKNTYDLIFLTSDGSLTSLSNDGYENWRMNSEVSWLQLSRMFSSSMNDDESIDSLRTSYRNQFRPSLNFFHIRLVQNEFLFKRLNKPQSISTILAVGWDSMTLVSRHTGQFLATHRLPTHPVANPIPIGLTRAGRGQTGMTAMWIVPCEGMFVAFSLVSELRVAYLALSITALFLIILCLSFCLDFYPGT